jgi:hypothetical protein
MLFVHAVNFRLQFNPFLGKLLAMFIPRAGMTANLVVRNVDEDIALALKLLAASHGKSACEQYTGKMLQCET